MLGKTILDSIGWTEKLGGKIQPKIEPIVEMNTKRFEQFKEEINAFEKDPVQLDIYLKEHGLDKVEGLRDYILNNDIQRGSVNELIQTQNFNNIADQAHGFKGVNAAIEEYKKLTDDVSRSKFAETISGTNAKLGTYLTNLNGATAGMGGYAKSLVIAKVKTIALQVATSAMNAAMSMGISIVISKVVEGIEYLTSANERYIESQQEIIDKTKEQIAEYDAEISSLNDLQDKLEDARGNKEKLAEIQKDLNKAVGETPGLINGESDAWSVANQKIIDRIALLEKLREEELQKNIQSTKNIYNAQVVDNDWGTDSSLPEYFNYSEREMETALSEGRILKSFSDLANEYLHLNDLPEMVHCSTLPSFGKSGIIVTLSTIFPPSFSVTPNLLRIFFPNNFYS